MAASYRSIGGAPLLLGALLLLYSLLTFQEDAATITPRSRLLQEERIARDYCNLTTTRSSSQRPLELLNLQPSLCASTIVPVFRYPPGYTSNEANHFLRDGIRKSDCLHETEKYLDANIWIYENHALPRYGDCTELERLMMDYVTRKCRLLGKEVANCSLPDWKIIQIEYADGWTWTGNPCGEPLLVSNRIKPFNFVWYKRSMVVNRTGLERTLGSVPSPDFYQLQGVTQKVFHIPYGVRSDIVLLIQSNICEKYNLTLPPTTKTPYNPVYLQRDGGVRHFFYAKRKQCRGECIGTATRGLVSLGLRELTSELYSETVALGRTEPLFSIRLGVAGEHNVAGRRFPQTAYVQDMLSHKIVVVAQRDNHEDMYRLMEAFASGALVLSDPMMFPPKYLVDGEHYVVYTSKEDLKRKVRFYIEECPAERLRIAEKGWKLAMQRYRSFHLMEQVILKQNVDI